MANELSRLDQFKAVVNNGPMFQRMKSAFGGDAAQAKIFAASMLDLYEGDAYLQQCDPQKVAMECLKAASLNLPLVKGLGFAYVVPYKKTATFQIGYKGLIQLALRSGQFKIFNADAVYEGERVTTDRLSGEITIEGCPTSDKEIGYFAYFKLINGFEKMLYITREAADAHGRRFSASYNSNSSPWKTDFSAMAKKTVIKMIMKWAPMSTEMVEAQKLEVAAEEVKAKADAQAMMGSAGVIDVQATEVPTQMEPEQEVIPDAGF